jgi:hypothetical protein
LPNVATRCTNRAGLRAPKASLIDSKHQSTARVAVLPAADRHAPASQFVAHTEAPQCANGIAGEIQAKTKVGWSLQPIDQQRGYPLLIKRTHHGKPGDATADDQHAAGA